MTIVRSAARGVDLSLPARELALKLETYLRPAAEAQQLAGLKRGPVLQNSGKREATIHVDSELAKIAGVSHDTIHKARIFDLWLACWTGEAIGEAVGCSDVEAGRVISDQKESLPPRRKLASEHGADFDVMAAKAKARASPATMARRGTGQSATLRSRDLAAAPHIPSPPGRWPTPGPARARA